VAPENNGFGPYPPLPHELLITPVTNGNAVTFSLGGAYKTLYLQAAIKGDSGGSTTLEVERDGTPFQFGGLEAIYQFSQPLTGPQNWIINVSGVQQLRLVVADVDDGIQGTSLLISG
jgi:hypothetical protein